MKYDPIKQSLGNLVRRNTVLRKLFYWVLGLLFLREWHVKRVLRNLLRQGGVKRMFDAGSGFGQYSYYCATHFPKVSILAVDVKDEQIRDCAQFFSEARIPNVTFAVEDLTKQHHSGEFDLVLSVDVMEHIADDVTVFRNFSTALKPNGYLIVNTPSTMGGSDAHSPDDQSFIEEHARIGYDVAEIRSKLESAGLTVDRISLTYGPWGSVAWRLGIKIPILMVNASRLFFLLLPFYYLLTLPFTLLFMYLDYQGENSVGSGLLVLARKSL